MKMPAETSLLNIISQIPDPRIDRQKRHKLIRVCNRVPYKVAQPRAPRARPQPVSSRVRWSASQIENVTIENVGFETPADAKTDDPATKRLSTACGRCWVL